MWMIYTNRIFPRRKYPETPFSEWCKHFMNNIFRTFFIPFRADRRFEIDFCILTGSRDNIRNVSCRIIHSFLNIYSCVCRNAAGSFNKISAQFLCNTPVRFLIIFRNKGLYWIFAAVSCIFTVYSWVEFDNSYKYVQNADWYRPVKLRFRQ